MIPVKITFSELTWRFANFILKNFAKMRCTFDPYHFRNFCNAHIRTLKKRFCIKNTHGSYILHNVNPHICFEVSAQVGWIYPETFGYRG